ncbi:MAG: efflux RND transporter permease subunit, partial [Pseudomonadota bacterium]
FRLAMWVMIGLPVCFLGAVMMMPALGITVNIVSLFAFIMVLGIVVDDAIVVVEAVATKMEKGMPSKQATIEAMREVSAPIVATSLSLIAVFVPVATMGGITGRLYQQFAITIAISVAISSVNALTLSPALAASLLKPPGEATSTFDRFFRAFNRRFEQATDRFMIFTGYFTNKLLRAGTLLAIIIVGIVMLFQAVPGGFVPEEDQGYVLAALQLPDAASLERTSDVMVDVQKILSQYDAIESYTAVNGFSMLTNTTQSNAGFIFIQLKEWDERPELRDHARNVVRRLNRDFMLGITEGMAFAFGPPAIPGLGTGSGFSMMLQDLGGNPPEYLAEQAASFIAAANERPEIANVSTLYRASVPQVFLDIDKPKALKLGVPLGDINTSIGAFLGGAYVNDFNRFGRLYKVYVQAEPEYRDSDEKLRFFYVRNSEGEMVPLSTLATTSRTQGAEFTNRFNLFRAATLTGQPTEGYSSAQALAALEEVATEVLPSDMGYAWADMSYQEKAAQGTGGVVFLMALVFVFLILAAQYESWSLPLSVMLGTPIAVFGAIAGLWLARLISESYVNNVFAQIGLVMLIGMAAKNAILIVEFASQEMQSGKDALTAALDAAKSRFRPILMTAFSFILGVVPLLIASGAGAEARKVMGVTVFSGMLASTVIGVLIVPAMFVFVERYISRRPPPEAESE